jgi:hypothetical protein
LLRLSLWLGEPGRRKETLNKKCPRKRKSSDPDEEREGAAIGGKGFSVLFDLVGIVANVLASLIVAPLFIFSTTILSF